MIVPVAPLRCVSRHSPVRRTRAPTASAVADGCTAAAALGEAAVVMLIEAADALSERASAAEVAVVTLGEAAVVTLGERGPACWRRPHLLEAMRGDEAVGAAAGPAEVVSWLEGDEAARATARSAEVVGRLVGDAAAGAAARAAEFVSRAPSGRALAERIGEVAERIGVAAEQIGGGGTAMYGNVSDDDGLLQERRSASPVAAAVVRSGSRLASAPVDGWKAE